MMQSDEKVAIAARNKLSEAVRSGVERFDGQVLQFYGDGYLSIFNSSLDGINAALSIQTSCLDEPAIPVRIGLHSGDIYMDEGTYYGDGVNIASRVESFAVSGSVLISSKIYDDIKNQHTIRTSSLGHFELKNVKEPVELFAIVNPPLVVPSNQDMQGKGKQRSRSIAVLPFVNMSNDPDNEYFSDGITEEILNSLVKVEGLKVTARTSSFAFKGQNVDIREIGKSLNVETVLEGSVRKAGNRVRITAQLINVLDGYHLWSHTFDRTLTDIFELQDEISKTIAHQLRQKLSLKSQQERLVEIPANNIEAYEEYLRGQYHWKMWTPDGVRKAQKHFQRSITLDPNFPLPYAALSGCYTLLGMSGNYLDTKEAFKLAQENADKAIEMDPEQPFSMISKAIIRFFWDRDMEGAEELFEKALSLNPGVADFHHYYGLYLCAKKDWNKADSELKTAVELDPLSTNTMKTQVDYLIFTKQFKKAKKVAQKVLDIDPNFRAANEALGWIYYHLGDIEKSLESFTKYQKQTGSPNKGLAGLSFVLSRTGQTEEAFRNLEKVKEREQTDPDVILDMDFALIYYGLNDMNKAFEHLEKAFEKRLGGFYISSDPIFEDLKKDHRFEPLMKKFKLYVNEP